MRREQAPLRSPTSFSKGEGGGAEGVLPEEGKESLEAGQVWLELGFGIRCGR